MMKGAVFMAKILIVDDEEMIRNVVREYAEFEGYETDEAEDGMQAVEKCRKNDYDLIVMDIMMPKLDGYSACKEIRKTKQIYPTRAALLISGNISTNAIIAA